MGPELLQGQGGLPPGPAREPGGSRQTQQEVLRPAGLGPSRGRDHDCPRERGLRRPAQREPVNWKLGGVSLGRGFFAFFVVAGTGFGPCSLSHSFSAVALRGRRWNNQLVAPRGVAAGNQLARYAGISS